MKRTVDIDIAGKTWPMCLTLRAFTDICDEYGSLQECIQKLDDLVEAGDNPGLIQHYTWLLDKLLWSAAQADDDPENYPPVQEVLKDLFSPGDLLYIQQKVLETIRIGQSREVGAEPPKNGVGAAEKPAPEA